MANIQVTDLQSLKFEFAIPSNTELETIKGGLPEACSPGAFGSAALQGGIMGALAGARTGTLFGVAGGAVLGAALGGSFGAIRCAVALR